MTNQKAECDNLRQLITVIDESYKDPQSNLLQKALLFSGKYSYALKWIVYVVSKDGENLNRLTKLNDFVDKFLLWKIEKPLMLYSITVLRFYSKLLEEDKEAFKVALISQLSETIGGAYAESKAFLIYSMFSSQEVIIAEAIERQKDYLSKQFAEQCNLDDLPYAKRLNLITDDVFSRRFMEIYPTASLEQLLDFINGHYFELPFNIKILAIKEIISKIEFEGNSPKNPISYLCYESFSLASLLTYFYNLCETKADFDAVVEIAKSQLDGLDDGEKDRFFNYVWLPEDLAKALGRKKKRSPCFDSYPGSVGDDYYCDSSNYGGTYAQDEMGYSDDDIETIFDGEPDAYWNID